MGANDKQVGGEHYQFSQQHWDRVVELDLCYHQGNATAYIERAFKKANAVEDLRKAAHYCEKLAELLEVGCIYNERLHPSDPHYTGQVFTFAPVPEEQPLSATRAGRKKMTAAVRAVRSRRK